MSRVSALSTAVSGWRTGDGVARGRDTVTANRGEEALANLEGVDAVVTDFAC